jgi:hypothetical protein
VSCYHQGEDGSRGFLLDACEMHTRTL